MPNETEIKRIEKNINIYIYNIIIYNILRKKNIYIYIGSRLGVPRSFQEPSVLSLYYKRRYGIEMGGMGGGVITSCGVRWIESCGNLEDVASVKMLLRCRRPMVLSLEATASKNLCGREDEKGVMFISSMVLQ